MKSIGLCSAYRSPEKDFGLWDRYYQQYFDQTAKDRGGDRSDAAAQSLAKYIGNYKALPGFSNHSSGIAFDATTVDGGDTLAANKNDAGNWRSSWLWKWLVANAATFDFKPLSTEEWHWDYKP